ncbi:MAG TPA: hypothetical protein V6C97_07635 [Oculatellaceae cyanobacterium]
MSQNQLATIPATVETMPSATDDESQVVERFMEASRDLVPNVQITLAKRIIRPGTNKVVCLAAKTSIPLHDDEVASVSDLALRLSDGTNVALSLSFFNDQGVEYATPLKRYVYSPADYNKKNRSHLGLVLMGMAAVFMAATTTLNSKPYMTFYNYASHPAAALSSKDAIKPLAALATGAAVRFGPPVPSVFKGPFKSQAKSSIKYKQSGNHTKSSHQSSPAAESHGQTLVPPPPPTPWVSSFGPLPVFDPRSLAGTGTAAATAGIVTNAKADAAKSEPVSKSEAKNAASASANARKAAESAKAAESLKGPEASTKTTTAAKSATPQTKNSVSEKPAAVERSAVTEKALPAATKMAAPEKPVADEKAQPSDDVSIIETKTYRPHASNFWPSSAAQASAPAPGDSTPMQLERIVPPSRDNF